MKKLKELLPYLIIVIAVVLIRTFIITPVIVDGKSMDPTLKNDQILILKKYDKTITRFEIVVLKKNGSKLVKRVIGLPGEHIEYKDNKLYVNGEFVEENFINTETKNFDTAIFGSETIPENYYFVLGDNRPNSADSRIIGLIHKNEIIGTTNFSLFPFTRFGIVK